MADFEQLTPTQPNPDYPWYIDREACMGDSLSYINQNTNYFGWKISEINEYLTELKTSRVYGTLADPYINARVIQNISTSQQDGMYINYNSTGSTTADCRIFANGVTERVTIKANTGNVGIGTTTPSTILDVNGTITATTINVGTGGITMGAGALTTGAGGITMGTGGLSVGSGGITVTPTGVGGNITINANGINTTRSGSFGDLTCFTLKTASDAIIGGTSPFQTGSLYIKPNNADGSPTAHFIRNPAASQDSTAIQFREARAAEPTNPRAIINFGFNYANSSTKGYAYLRPDPQATENGTDLHPGLRVYTNGRVTVNTELDTVDGTGYAFIVNGSAYTSTLKANSITMGSGGFTPSSTTTGTRPINPPNGTIIWNTSTSQLNVYVNGVWKTILREA
jgi:hypothetical protein